MSAISQVGLVKNPLTIIAMFAVIAEVSGALVLPFLSVSVQEIYVWFLICFPTTLVLFFFITLWTKRDALYGPSDYRDEKHFMAALRPATRFEIAGKNATETLEAFGDSLWQKSDPVIPAGQPTGLEAEQPTRPQPSDEATGSEGQGEIESSSAVSRGSEGDGAKHQSSPKMDAPDDVTAIRDMRLKRMMKKRALMKESALSEAVSRFPKAQFDMKVGDVVVDAVAVVRDSVTLIETHYVGSGTVAAAIDDLNAVVTAARAFRASADDSGPLTVLFVLYSDDQSRLNSMFYAVSEKVRMTRYKGVNVQVVPVKINELLTLAQDD